jgi:hypothetical protein
MLLIIGAIIIVNIIIAKIFFSWYKFAKNNLHVVTEEELALLSCKCMILLPNHKCEHHSMNKERKINENTVHRRSPREITSSA